MSLPSRDPAQFTLTFTFTVLSSLFLLFASCAARTTRHDPAPSPSRSTGGAVTAGESQCPLEGCDSGAGGGGAGGGARGGAPAVGPAGVKRRDVAFEQPSFFPSRAPGGGRSGGRGRGGRCNSFWTRRALKGIRPHRHRCRPRRHPLGNE